MRRVATLISSLLVASSLSASAEYVFRVPAPIKAGADQAPQLSFSPQALSFDVTVGQSQTLTARLANAGPGAASPLQLSGPLTPYSATHDCGASLAAGASCDVSVTFAPTAAGPFGGGVQARSGTAGVVLDLNGTARQGQFAVTPTSLAFGDVSVGSTGTLTATLSNTGDAALPVAFGTLAAPYSLTHDCGATLDPAATCTLTVTFSPTVAGATSPGLAIGSGDTGATLGLSGTGLATVIAAQAVAAGDNHSLVVKADGTLWAAGYNANGQLGDGTPTNRSTFVQVLAGVQSVAAGTAHSMALKTDGTLWATGANNNGQFGDGTTTSRSTFVQVLSDVQAVYAGDNHTVVLKIDGTAWAAGLNDRGQLGLGDLANRSVFTRLP
jgi:hypothetical protein